MKSLKEIIAESAIKETAVGHFNISELTALKAIFESARELNLPVIIGTSEGERKFIGLKQAVSLVKSIREEYDYPIFLNADHTHSLEKVREAAEAGYDAILFDGGKLPFEENVRQTKAAVEIAKSVNPSALIEGEIGYIGSSSEVQKKIPAGAALNPEELTSPQQAKEFIEETGVDFLAPAVGNIHGIIVQAGFTERLDIERIKSIKGASGISLVLHGGSGLDSEDFRKAIKAGINIVHISTEIRQAWRIGLEAGLKNNPEEIAPYKIYPPAIEEMKKVIIGRLRVFSNL
ncbi:MAG: class II fructose-bisphosphate aldolase [Candidatus Liptonbacteria bacterium]|nr:class II fructose-bisphosphate aldolase [Candidatus Liptonbacteria bacterium]